MKGFKEFILRGHALGLAVVAASSDFLRIALDMDGSTPLDAPRCAFCTSSIA